MGIRSKQIERLDKVFSLYIRLSNSDDEGYCKCISCGYIDHYKNMHNGHYIDRKHMSTRWDVDNCNVQCPSCNVGLNGNLEGYLSTIGDDLGQELTRRKYLIKKYSMIDLEELIELYTDLIKPYKI